MTDEHGICDDERCYRRECRQNRRDTERANRWADQVVRTHPNRADRRRAAKYGYKHRPRPFRHPLAMEGVR